MKCEKYHCQHVIMYTSIAARNDHLKRVLMAGRFQRVHKATEGITRLRTDNI